MTSNAAIVADYDIFSVPMAQIVEDAWSLRAGFDLTTVGYGQVHWGDMKQVVTTPYSYYYFLAGMTRLTNARRVVEVGTHQGGSTRALAAGLVNPASSRVVTFDVTDFGAAMFDGDPVIRAHTVDANSEAAFDTCVREFGEPKIDLAFIDTTHEFWTTLQSFMLYAEVIECPLILLDDITLNERMMRLWGLLRLRYGGENTIDATQVDPGIRTGGVDTRPGFGVVRIAPRRRFTGSASR